MRSLRATPVVLGLILNAVIVAGICALLPLMMPCKTGTVDDFWYVALQVDFQGKANQDRWGGAVFLDEGWFYYEYLHIHGSDLYRISEAEAMSVFPDVVRILDTMALNPDRQARVVCGYREWMSFRDLSKKGLLKLLDLIEIERAKHLPEAYDSWIRQKVMLWKRVEKLKYFPAGVAFEIVFLSGLVWFVAWPIAGGRSCRRVARRISVVPFLFFLPAYLGYCTWSFTSIGPSGGVLVPWLYTFARGGTMFDFELTALGYVPQILEPLTQDFGYPIAMTGMGMSGPTVLLGYGVVSAALMLICSWIWRRRVAANRGFAT